MPTDAEDGAQPKAIRPSQHSDAIPMSVPDQPVRRPTTRLRPPPPLTSADRAIIAERRARRERK